MKSSTQKNKKEYKYCQSCGMPLKQDKERHKAKGLSEKYCSYCYQDNKFTYPEVDTPQKMQKMCIKIMHEKQKMPKFVAWLLTRGIPRLERWQK